MLGSDPRGIASSQRAGVAATAVDVGGQVYCIRNRFPSRLIMIAPHRFIPCLTLLHRFSIGLRSGDYGGKYSSLAPAASMAVRTPATLWVARLSKMTPSSRCSLGTSPCFTQAKNSSPPSARRTATGFVALGDTRRQSSWSSENGRGARLRPAARPPRSNSGWRQGPPCSCPVRKDEESVPAPTPEWLSCPNPATPAPYSKATCFMDTF